MHRVIGGLKHLNMHWDDNWFFGPCPHRDRDYHIGSNFWKFDKVLPFTQGTYVLLAHPLVLIKGSMGLELIEPVLGSYLLL